VQEIVLQDEFDERTVGLFPCWTGSVFFCDAEGGVICWTEIDPTFPGMED